MLTVDHWRSPTSLERMSVYASIQWVLPHFPAFGTVTSRL